MKISKIEIKNFKGFKDKSFEFKEQFTVLIGNNGKGKTSAMEALAVALGAYMLGVGYKSAQRHIQKEDIHKIDLGDRFVHQLPVEVWAEGEIDHYKNLRWGRLLSTYEGRTTTKEAAPILEISKEHAQKTNSPQNTRVNLPVLAYYGTGRLWIEKQQRINTKGKGSILEDGYYACLEPKSNSIAYLEWFHTYEYSILTQKKDQTLLNLVKQAISDCIEDWREVHFDFNENDLVGTRTLENGTTQKMPFRLLSDGQRNIAGMVAELAYRCITLNGHLDKDALVGSHGVVLIDEIDQHLHPNWQKHIVADLKRIFPNIQFIASTHSPFIVQSLKKTELINLDEMEGVEGDLFKHSLEEVAEFEMGVEMPQRSQKFLEMEAVAGEYFTLIAQGKTSEKDAKTAQLRQRLNELEELYNDDPAFVALLKAEKNSKNL